MNMDLESKSWFFEKISINKTDQEIKREADKNKMKKEKELQIE